MVRCIDCINFIEHRCIHKSTYISSANAHKERRCGKFFSMNNGANDNAQTVNNDMRLQSTSYTIFKT